MRCEHYSADEIHCRARAVVWLVADGIRQAVYCRTHGEQVCREINAALVADDDPPRWTVREMDDAEKRLP
jgi:hypothetical protein